MTRCEFCAHLDDHHLRSGPCSVYKCECSIPLSVSLSSLVNGTAICARYGVAKSTLSGWQTRNGFPKPMDVPGLIGVKVWDCSEVEKWHDNWIAGRR